MEINKRLGLIVLTLLLNTSTYASPAEEMFVNGDTIGTQKDIIDIYLKLIGKSVRTDTSRLYGKGPFFALIPAVGYGMHTGITGVISTNTTFYTSEERKKISRINIEGDFSQYRQYWVKSTSNVFLEKLRLHLFNDTRCMKFPTRTFGLGPGSRISGSLKIDYSYLRFYQLVFREIIPNVFAGFGYNLDYHWNVEADTISGNTMDQFAKYQKGINSVSSGISFNLLYDSRANAINPHNGSFLNVQFRPNLKSLGSDSNWQSMLIDIRHYFNLPESTKNILAFWSYNDLTLRGTPPYLDMPSTGWDDYSVTGRGYVPGRFTAKNLVYLESEYRFSVSSDRLLGGVVFCNYQHMTNVNVNNKFSIIPGGGAGVRIKLSKFTDTNLAIDYGFGIGGSHGLFFNMGEVF